MILHSAMSVLIYYIGVLVLGWTHSRVKVSSQYCILLHMSSNYNVGVLILLYLCPHTTIGH
jgi:hypothetical protein